MSALLGTELPGAGTIYLSQQLQFLHPVGIGDTLTITMTVTAKHGERHVVVVECCCTNEHGEKVVTGTAEVIALTEKSGSRALTYPKHPSCTAGATVNGWMQALPVSINNNRPPPRWRPALFSRICLQRRFCVPALIHSA